MKLGLILLLCAATCRADDFEKLSALLAPGGNIVIPPGEYQLAGDKPLPLQSGMNIIAHGARFVFPKVLGARARAVMFAGENIENLRWTGGHFQGFCFDPARDDNTWEPNANSRGILITTRPRRGDNVAFDQLVWDRLPGGVTANLTFRDITSDGLCGAAITILGAEKKGSEREVDTYARDITIESCTLLRTGKFMWDYGYLWQITVWPEDHTPAQRAMAAKYFRNDLVKPVKMEGDQVLFSNAKSTIGRNTVCFFGDTLPANLVRGKQYFVVENTPTSIRIADKSGAEPIKFDGPAGPDAKIIINLSAAFPALYAPTGSGPGKGAFDLVACEKVIVRGCRLSALGDTMHIQKSRGVIFADNHILGSRMGAFFLAEFCKDATITGNIVDGTNGSRVVSVEKACEDVTIVGNTFRNGGRGSWINQPRNLVLADNVFVNNTTKCEPDPKRGRRSYVNGEYEKYAEVYFTTFEPNGRYGNVIVRGNVFTSGAHAQHAMSFAPGGETIMVIDNIFAGAARDIAPIEGCENVTVRGNVEGKR